jgi:hypothetical protein
MATNIPPHNLGEVIDGLKLLVENPDCTLEELMECIKGPDFPTGGIIMGRSGIRAAYATGRGKITLRSNTTIEEIKGRNCIIVHEIPYMVNKARLIEHIAELVKDILVGADEGMSASALLKSAPIAEYVCYNGQTVSSQKLTNILTKLVESKDLTRTMVKKVPMFALNYGIADADTEGEGD